MAEQSSILKMEGQLGGLVFYKSRNKFFVRTKSKRDKKQVATDHRYARVRENNADFSTAAKAAKLLREAFNSLIMRGDLKLSNRLQRRIMQVLKGDLCNARGKRSVANGELELLQGFEFSGTAALQRTMRQLCTLAFNHTKSVGVAVIAPYTPALDIVAPPGATHFTLSLGIAACNFGKNTYISSVAHTEPQALANEASDFTVLRASLSLPFSSPVFLVLGIRFFTCHGKKYYPLLGSNAHALSIMKVHRP